jgi:hypothetical protein
MGQKWWVTNFSVGAEGRRMQRYVASERLAKTAVGKWAKRRWQTVKKPIFLR